MSGPYQECLECGRKRSCSRHMRAEFPPFAAKRWLQRTCETKDHCNIHYRADISPLLQSLYQTQREP